MNVRSKSSHPIYYRRQYRKPVQFGADAAQPSLRTLNQGPEVRRTKIPELTHVRGMRGLSDKKRFRAYRIPRIAFVGFKNPVGSKHDEVFVVFNNPKTQRHVRRIRPLQLFQLKSWKMEGELARLTMRDAQRPRSLAGISAALPSMQPSVQ